MVAAIAYLCGKGLSPRQIAEMCGVRPQGIAARIAYYRRRGWLPPGLRVPTNERAA
jgi:transposase